MTNEDLPHHPVEYLWVDALYTFWQNRGVIPSVPPANTVYLIGCKNINGGPGNILGLTIWRSSEQNNHKISMIIVERILSTYTQTTLNKKYVTYTTIHELGHARGMNFTESQGYYDGNITDVYHTGGHNGTHNKYCVMRVRNNQDDPEFTEERFLKALDDSKFCYGHLQMLLNADWW